MMGGLSYFVASLTTIYMVKRYQSPFNVVFIYIIVLFMEMCMGLSIDLRQSLRSQCKITDFSGGFSTIDILSCVFYE